MYRIREDAAIVDRTAVDSLIIPVQFSDDGQDTLYDDIYSSAKDFLEYLSEVGSLNITSESTIDVPISEFISNAVLEERYIYDEKDWMTVTIGFSSVISAVDEGEYVLHGSMFYKSNELDDDVKRAIGDSRVYLQMTDEDFGREYGNSPDNIFRVPLDLNRQTQTVDSIAPINGAVSERITNLQIVNESGDVLGSAPVVYFSATD